MGASSPYIAADGLTRLRLSGCRALASPCSPCSPSRPCSGSARRRRQRARRHARPMRRSRERACSRSATSRRVHLPNLVGVRRTPRTSGAKGVERLCALRRAAEGDHPRAAGDPPPSFTDDDRAGEQRGRRVPVRPRRERDARALREVERRRLSREPVREDRDAGSRSQGRHVDVAAVTIERQDIAGLGDDSVVYEGKIVLTGDRRATTIAGHRQRGGARRAHRRPR